IPALVLGLGLPMQVAVGSSLVIVVVNAIGGLAAHAPHLTDLDPAVITAFTLTAMTGSLAATRLSRHLNPDRLRRAFAYLVFAVAAYVSVQALVS
ncbi:TSUP family transporter, partial [Actinomadura adrarensis]